jgi:hypothetical protein
MRGIGAILNAPATSDEQTKKNYQPKKRIWERYTATYELRAPS